MRNTRVENIEEHSLQVAIIGHALALIRKEYFPIDNDGKDRIKVDENLVTTLAVYHDTNEILTGDMPTPVKYFNISMTGAYKEIEHQASQKLVSMLPPELSSKYEELLSPDRSNPDIDAAMQIVKAADKISALIKCIEESKAGNSEFVSASKRIRKTIEQIELPEVKYFMDNFIPAFSKTLDELES